MCKIVSEDNFYRCTFVWCTYFRFNFFLFQRIFSSSSFIPNVKFPSSANFSFQFRIPFFSVCKKCFLKHKKKVFIFIVHNIIIFCSSIWILNWVREKSAALQCIARTFAMNFQLMHEIYLSKICKRTTSSLTFVLCKINQKVKTFPHPFNHLV